MPKIYSNKNEIDEAEKSCYMALNRTFACKIKLLKETLIDFVGHMGPAEDVNTLV